MPALPPGDDHFPSAALLRAYQHLYGPADPPPRPERRRMLPAMMVVSLLTWRWLALVLGAILVGGLLAWWHAC